MELFDRRTAVLCTAVYEYLIVEKESVTVESGGGGSGYFVPVMQAYVERTVVEIQVVERTMTHCQAGT